jgi:hypothetical protein
MPHQAAFRQCHLFGEDDMYGAYCIMVSHLWPLKNPLDGIGECSAYEGGSYPREPEKPAHASITHDGDYGFSKWTVAEVGGAIYPG